MGANSYSFATVWRLEADVLEVAQIIADVNALTRWWPAVYLEVRELEPGEPSGVGKVIDLYTKGWLPYTLRWRFRVTEVEYARRIVLVAEGDFAGRGVWTFAQDGPEAVISYQWDVQAEKPLLRRLSFLLRPIFAANHHWAMRMGEVSLRRELARRRAASPIEAARVPPPPGPTPSSPVLLTLVVAGTMALLALAFRRLVRRR